jgi:hypothetical protein
MTHSELFFEVLDKYEIRSIKSLENWETEDLVELQEALRAELAERDRIAQEEYYEDDKREEEDCFFIDDDDVELWECEHGNLSDTHCPACLRDSYGGTDSE